MGLRHTPFRAMNNADDIKWTAAASLQSLFWFFALPTLLKPHWEGFWSGYSPLQAQVLLNEIGLAYFAVAALLMVPIYAGNYAFFEQYKISDQEWHWRSEKPEVRVGHCPCVDFFSLCSLFPRSNTFPPLRRRACCCVCDCLGSRLKRSVRPFGRSPSEAACCSWSITGAWCRC